MSKCSASDAVNAVPPQPDTDTDTGRGRGKRAASATDEKHKQTSPTFSSSSLHSTSSRRSKRVAPIAGNGNGNGNTDGLPSEAPSTLVNTDNPSSLPGHTDNATAQDGEKNTSVTEHNETPAAEKAEGATENTDDDEIVYPGGLQLGLLSFGLCMATFTVALDSTIIATAIPKITTVFDSLGDVGWYGSSYLLTTTALQPSFGRIYTYFDVKYTYLFALCLFELGSIICAAARNSVMLIIGRAVAGAGASALFSGGECGPVVIPQLASN